MTDTCGCSYQQSHIIACNGHAEFPWIPDLKTRDFEHLQHAHIRTHTSSTHTQVHVYVHLSHTWLTLFTIHYIYIQHNYLHIYTVIYVYTQLFTHIHVYIYIYLHIHISICGNVEQGTARSKALVMTASRCLGPGQRSSLPLEVSTSSGVVKWWSNGGKMVV